MTLVAGVPALPVVDGVPALPLVAGVSALPVVVVGAIVPVPLVARFTVVPVVVVDSGPHPSCRPTLDPTTGRGTSNRPGLRGLGLGDGSRPQTREP